MEHRRWPLILRWKGYCHVHEGIFSYPQRESVLSIQPCEWMSVLRIYQIFIFSKWWNKLSSNITSSLVAFKCKPFSRFLAMILWTSHKPRVVQPFQRWVDIAKERLTFQEVVKKMKWQSHFIQVQTFVMQDSHVFIRELAGKGGISIGLVF